MLKHLLRKINSLDARKSAEALKIDLYSTLIPYIFSREVYNDNKDLKEFIDKLSLKLPVKDYLYSARPQIVARISKEIFHAEKEMLVENMNVLKKDAERFMEESKNNGLGDKPTKKDFVEVINKYSRNKEIGND